MMIDFIKILQEEFLQNANSEIAKGQKKYMRDKFMFLGISSPKRKVIQKPFLVSKYLPQKEKLHTIVTELWNLQEREYQYFAQEFAYRYIKKIQVKDIQLFKFMIVHKSWWDTVDFIAVKLVGEYFKKYPDEIQKNVDFWIASDNIWLQRTAILFQLKYKEMIDTILLQQIIDEVTPTNEFFINKAIGWILHEYSKTNPSWVTHYLLKTDLSNLTKREASKYL